MRPAGQHKRNPLSWIGRHEFALLAWVLLLAAATWGFLELAGVVTAGRTRELDEQLLLALRDPANRADPLGPRWLEEFARDVTALGSPGILTLITLAAGGFLWLAGKRRVAGLLCLAVLGALALGAALKWGIDRPRPDLVPHGTPVASRSFPSGHSMGAAAAYLTLGVLLARVQPRLRLKAYVLLLSLLVTVLVGLSRVYLGVHWPTDVLAGWMAGAAWALLCGISLWWLQRRGRAETQAEGHDAVRVHSRPP